MNIREKIGDIMDRMKMYNLHLIGVTEGQNFQKWIEGELLQIFQKWQNGSSNK